MSYDAYIHSSHEEGFSNAILEAMAAALPIIATKVGGNTDQVKHMQSGILVEPHSPHNLANAMEQLVFDPVLRERLGQNARLRYINYFTLDRSFSNLLNLL